MKGDMVRGRYVTGTAPVAGEGLPLPRAIQTLARFGSHSDRRRLNFRVHLSLVMAIDDDVAPRRCNAETWARSSFAICGLLLAWG